MTRPGVANFDLYRIVPAKLIKHERNPLLFKLRLVKPFRMDRGESFAERVMYRTRSSAQREPIVLDGHDLVEIVI